MIIRRLILPALAALALSACGRADHPADAPLVVAASATPHAEILDIVRPRLEAEGVTLEVRVFNDYVQPNLLVEQGRADANYFQTKPHLDAFNAAHDVKLVAVAGVHVEPFGAYSRKHQKLDQLPTGAVVAIPNEPSNGGRALLLLHKAGVIRLRDPSNALSTLKDVVGNPKQLKFRELEAATLPRVLDQVDLALINTNYALDAGLNPTKDALALESADSPYVNFLVARADRVNDPKIRKLAAALRSPEVKTFIEGKYQGAVLPAF